MMLATVPASGTNTALIGHINFPNHCPVLGELSSGEAAIYRPDGAGGFALIGRVSAYAWADLP